MGSGQMNASGTHNYSTVLTQLLSRSVCYIYFFVLQMMKNV